MGEIAAFGGLLGLALSVVLLAWQCREVARQTKISNSVAGASVLQESIQSLGAFQHILIERPELRRYFYDSAPRPEAGETRDRLLAVAELLADAIEVGLFASRLVVSTGSAEDWESYTRDMIGYSPVLRETIQAHPVWYPMLTELLTD
jgi:hypothetical protein